MNLNSLVGLLLLSSNLAFAQQYSVICPSSRMVGNSLDTGIDIKPELSGNGVTLDTTTITFTYPLSVGDVVTVAYKSERHPASVTYSSMEFFTISHSPNRIEERYTIHIPIFRFTIHGDTMEPLKDVFLRNFLPVNGAI